MADPNEFFKKLAAGDVIAGPPAGEPQEELTPDAFFEQQQATSEGKPSFDTWGDYFKGFGAVTGRALPFGYGDEMYGAAAGGADEASRGKATAEARAYTSAFKDEYPIAGMGAEILGMIPGGMGVARGAIAAGRGGTKLLPKIVRGRPTAMGNWTTQSSLGRIGINAGSGLVEGSLYATGEDQNVLTGAITGLVGGAAGQAVLGEVMPGGLKWMFGKKFDAKDAYTARVQLQEAFKNMGFEVNAMSDDVFDAMALKLNELGPNASVADLTESTAEILGRLRASKPAPSISYAISDTLADPNYGRQFSNEIDRAVAGPVLTNDQVGNIAKRQQAAMQPHFDRALDNPQLDKWDGTNVANEILSFGGTGTVTNKDRAIRNNLSKWFNANVPLPEGQKSWFKDGALNVPDGMPTPQLSARDLHGLRVQIDDLIATALSGNHKTINKNALKDLYALRAGISEHLNTMVPGFQELSLNYKGVVDSKNAFGVGNKLILDDKLAPEDFKAIFDAMSPEVRSFAMEGLKRKLIQEVGKTGGSDRLMKRMAASGGRTFKNKMEQTFGTDLGAQLAASADLDIAKEITKGAVRKAGGDMELGNKPLAQYVDLLLTTGLLGSNTAVSNAAALGAVRREVAGVVSPHATRAINEAAGIMTSAGKAAQENLQRLKGIKLENAPLAVSDFVGGAGIAPIQKFLIGGQNE